MNLRLESVKLKSSKPSSEFAYAICRYEGVPSSPSCNLMHVTSALARTFVPSVASNRYTAFVSKSVALTVILVLVDKDSPSLYQVIEYLDVMIFPLSLTKAVNTVESSSVLNRIPFVLEIEPS